MSKTPSKPYLYQLADQWGLSNPLFLKKNYVISFKKIKLVSYLIFIRVRFNILVEMYLKYLIWLLIFYYMIKPISLY